MASATTYNNCERLYVMKRNKGELTPDYVQTQLSVIDVFLIAGRITDDQYRDLSGILNSEPN